MVDNCKLVYVDGVAMAFDSNGEKSSLYEKALEYTDGNQEEAVKIWASTQSEEFVSEVGEENPSLQTVLRFLNNRVDKHQTLSSQELKEVSLMMSDMGISDLNEFTQKMNNLFQPNGYYEVDSKKLMKSGLYSVDDIANLNHTEVKSFLEKLNNFNEHKEFTLSVAPNKTKVQLRNTTAKKTPIGSYPLVSEQELVEYIIDNSDDLSTQSINRTIGNSPFAQILDNPKAMKAVMGMLNGKRKVNKMFFDGANFTSENIDTFVTLRNTLLANADPLELEADLEFIESISPFVWDNKQEEIKNVLKEIERTAIKFNIDIIGLSELSNDRDTVLSLLSSLDDMLLVPSIENIQNFARKKDEKIAPNKSYTVVQEKEEYKGYNIVKIDTNLSDDIMFQKGFLRIDNNGLYHRIQKANIAEMYEVVYDMVQDNTLIIPNEFFNQGLNIKDPANKDAVMSGIVSYINSRDTGIDTLMVEEVSLMQTIFAHKKLKKTVPQDITTNEEYLKTSFVSDFYNYVLEEKQKNTDLYNKVLKYFTVTDADITLDALNTPDVTGIKYEQELRDYSRLKKDGQIKDLEKGESKNEDLIILNNPQKVKEEGNTNYVVGNDGYVLTEPNPKTYIRVGGKLYRKLFDKSNGALYKEVVIPSNTLYFDNNLNFDFNREEAESVHKKLSKSLQKETVKTAEELSKNVNIPNKIMPIQYQIIGEQGASRMIEYKQQLDRAKELEKEGKTPAQIELETGWYKYKGDWRTIPKEVVESFQIKDRTVNKELTLKQVLGDDSTIFNFYPEISGAKVVFLGENYKNNAFEEVKKQTFGFVDEKTGTIYINMATTNPSTGDRVAVEEDEQVRTLAHEVNHLIQSIEGFPTGGNLLTVAYKAMDIIGEKELTLVELYDKLITTDLAGLNENEKLIVSSTVEALKMYNTTNNTYGFTNQYNHLLGELDSKIVEEAINIRNRHEAVPSYLQLFNRVTSLRGINLNNIIVVKGKNGGLKLNISAQKDSKETVEEVINKLKQTGLSSEVFQLNTTQLQEKLKELGVSDDIAMQVVMQIKNGYYSNAQTAFTNLKDKNVKNTQGWLKALTDVQKNGGVKNVNQELEWIGLEYFLNEYVKENNPKNGNIPANVVEEYILSNQIEIVDVSKKKFRRSNNEIDAILDKYKPEGTTPMRYYNSRKQYGYKITATGEFIEVFDQSLRDMMDEIREDRFEERNTKYSEYQLKGGENYREVLLTMPDKKKKVFGELSETLDYARDTYGINSTEYRSAKKSLANTLEEEWGLDYDAVQDLFVMYEESPNAYKSSHWDEANILAHVRLNEKTLPDGRRVLIVNEIQSDWAQDGRKKGFIKKEKITEQDLEVKEEKDVYTYQEEKDGSTTFYIIYKNGERTNREFDTKLEAEKEIDKKKPYFNAYYEGKVIGTSTTKEGALKDGVDTYNNVNKSIYGVAQMPYKNTDQWVGLVTRRVMQMASQEGYDGIAFATGQQSADMYSLSQQVDKIDISPQGDVKAVYISMKNNEDDTVFINQEGVITESASGAYNGKQAEEVLGKDLTRKILETEEETTLEGEGLEFGGEGMKTFYDKIVPKVVQKEVQRFDKNAKLETVDFSEQPLRVTTDESGNRILVDYTGEVVDSQYGNRFTTDQEYIDAFKDAYNNSKGVTVNKDDKLSLGVQPYLPLTESIKESVSQGIPQFQKALSQQGINLIPNGFIYKDQVFLNSGTMTPDLIFHEFQHLFLKWSKEARPDIYNRGLELARKELEKSNFVGDSVRVFDYLVPTKELDKIKEFERTDALLGEEYYNKLKEDIRKFGIREPITIIEQDGKMIINEGNHRLRVAKELGIENIPVTRSRYKMSDEQFSKASPSIDLRPYGFTVPQMLNKENVLDNRKIGKSEIQDVIDYVRTTQSNLTGEALENEIITEFIGRYSKQMMDEQKAKSPLMQWLSDFWASVKEMLGITDMTPAQVANLTLEEYAKASVVTLSKGEQIQFQKIVYDARVENRAEMFQMVNDFGIVINNLYPKSKENEIKDKFDECRI